MQNERQQNNSRYESEKSDDMLKMLNCVMIFQNGVPATENQFIGKKQGLSIREKFYGKDNPRLCDFYAEMSEILLRGGEYKNPYYIVKKL